MPQLCAARGSLGTERTGRFIHESRGVRVLDSDERFMVARRVWLVRWILERYDQPGVRDWADSYLETHLRGLREDLDRLS